MANEEHLAILRQGVEVWNQWRQKTSIIIPDLSGVNFSGADLSGVNLSFVNLSGSNFRGANLKGADLGGIDLCAFDFNGANLQWVDLNGANLSRLDLSGFELSGVDLTDADLTEVKLSRANLSEANLSGLNLSEFDFSDVNLRGANLSRIQALETNFTGATLTGACIQDWNINSATNLSDVICEYIYLKQGQQERRPSSENFPPREFTKLFQKVLETVDLIFADGIDWKAFILSFQELRDKYGDENLSVQAIEKKSGGAFVIRLEVPPEANKAEIERQAKQLYEKELKIFEVKYHAELKAKDEQIAIIRQHNTSLESIIHILANRPINNVIEVTTKAESKSMSEAPKKQSNFNLQGAQFGGGLVDAETVNAHQIGGDITNYNQVARTEVNNSPVKTILILAANPKNTLPLRLGEEVREIDAGLQRAKKRELFDLKQRWAVRVQEVYQSLLNFKPQIVHFSGHGAGDDGLALEDETGNVRLVGTDALAKLFELFASNVECVVLNACYSEVQAQTIVKHIPYVIGMNKQIGDKAAIKFATGFYSALGAGESVEFAYKLGCSVIQLHGIPENLTPALKKKQ